MIRDIVDGICQALAAEFGDEYEIYTESLPQGIKEPCFFVLCISQEHGIQSAHRYLKTYQFSIQYFPLSDDEPYAESQETTERMCRCLELIKVGDAKVWGKEMNGHMEDGVLIFTVEYNPFICRPRELAEMEKVVIDANVKG